MTHMLRMSQQELDGYRKRAEAKNQVRTHVLDDKAAPKLIVQILMNDVRAAGLPEPDLEHRFHPKRQWRFDLAWAPDKVALEIEGGIWIQGRHNRGEGMLRDMEKYNEAQLMGWTVLRYSTEQIKNSVPIADLRRALGAEEEVL